MATDTAAKNGTRAVASSTDGVARPRAEKNAASKSRGVAKAQSGASSLKSTLAATAEKAARLSAACSAASQTVATVKAKRARLPADFAAQYQREGKNKKPLAPVAAPKKRARRSAAERENLRRALVLDDDLLQRLARAGAIGGGNGSAPLRPKSAPRRSRKWESRCGKCGTHSTFSTPASLCARCGTIVVRSD